MKEVVLKTNNLTKQYNKNVVLDNVNITIKKGGRAYWFDWSKWCW